MRYLLAVLLLLGCTRHDDAKDKEIAALKAQLAAKPAPSLGAVQSPSKVEVVTPKLPNPMDDPQITSLLTLDTDEARQRFAAWVSVFGRELTPLQQDRAVAHFVQMAHDSAAGMRYNWGIQALDKIGHVRDPASLTETLQKWLKKRGLFELSRMSDPVNAGPEAAHAIYRYDSTLFEKLLAELKTTGKLPTSLLAQAPEDLDGDYAATWVTFRTPDDKARYLAWRDAIGRGLTPEQAERVRRTVINHYLVATWDFYLSFRRFPLYDDLGHFQDLSALTLKWKGWARKQVLQLPGNFGPETGAAVGNFQAPEVTQAPSGPAPTP